MALLLIETTASFGIAMERAFGLTRSDGLIHPGPESLLPQFCFQSLGVARAVLAAGTSLRKRISRYLNL